MNVNFLPKTLGKFLVHFLKPHRWALLLMTILFLATSVEKTIIPYFFKLIVDAVEAHSTSRELIFRALWPIIAQLIGMLILLETCFRAKGILNSFVMPKIMANIRCALLQYVQNYSIRYFQNVLVGDVASKISDMPGAVEHLIDIATEMYIPVFISAIMTIYLLSRIDLFITVQFFVWFVIHAGITFFCASKCSYYSYRHADALSKLRGVIIDSLKNIDNMKLFSARKSENQYIDKYQEEERKKNGAMLFYVEKVEIFLSITTVLQFLGTLVISTYRWQQGFLSVGDLVFIFATMTNVLSLAWWMALETTYVFEQVGYCKQSLSILHNAEEDLLCQKLRNESFQITNGEIEFRNVSFAYDASRKILENFNLKIKAGNKVGIIGYSGSGKSTLISLLLRRYEVDEGEILIDDVNTANICPNELRQHLVIVPQNVLLFHRSIAENIKYANPGISDEEMIEAAKRANCHDFILKLEDQYNTIVGENGLKLSGGQRQLIGVARAIVKKARIIILDEATSSLDIETELSLKKSLEEFILKENVTAIVIAHRIATLRQMDRIIVFHDGKIMGDGTHAELMANNAHYQKLWNIYTDV